MPPTTQKSTSSSRVASPHSSSRTSLPAKKRTKKPKTEKLTTSRSLSTTQSSVNTSHVLKPRKRAASGKLHKNALRLASEVFSEATSPMYDTESDVESMRSTPLDTSPASHVYGTSASSSSLLPNNVPNFVMPLVHEAAGRVLLALTAQEQQMDTNSPSHASSHLYQDTTRELTQLIHLVMQQMQNEGNAPMWMEGLGANAMSQQNDLEKEALAQEVQELKLELAEREDNEVALQHELQSTREELDEISNKYRVLSEENAKNVHFLNVLRGFHEDLLNANKGMFQEVNDIIPIMER